MSQKTQDDLFAALASVKAQLALFPSISFGPKLFDISDADLRALIAQADTEATLISSIQAKISPAEYDLLKKRNII